MAVRPTVNSGTFTPNAATQDRLFFCQVVAWGYHQPSDNPRRWMRACPHWLAFSARRRRLAHCETSPLCPEKFVLFISRQRAKAFRIPSSQQLLSCVNQLSGELGRLRSSRGAVPRRLLLSAVSTPVLVMQPRWDRRCRRAIHLHLRFLALLPLMQVLCFAPALSEKNEALGPMDVQD